ncbi:MAG: hypothetical protein IT370_00095 [Deltaproteobacteria bacterium]|nr:hypothetical protein [Deltaproteobacteria bacterium]
MLRFASLGAVLLLASCGVGAGDAGDGDGGSDAAGPGVDAGSWLDAAPTVDATPPQFTCSTLPVGAATVDLPALHGALVREQWARGRTGTNGEVGTDALYLRSIRAALDPGAADPGVATVGWLVGLDAATFDASELTVSNAPADWASAQSASLVVLRSQVGGTATRFARPAVSASLQREATGWQLVSLVIWPSVSLATPAEVAALAACSTDTPPAEDAVRAHRFEGLRFRGCGMVGSYAYTPATGDVVDWRSPVTWEALDDAGTWRGAPTRWRLSRPATLTIAPANYFPDIAEADCLCGDSAGYELTVDIVTGVVLRYRPGINCVVC